jgi:tetratricopeptide (TPR) repeat protein
MREVIDQSRLPPKNARQLVYALYAAELVQPARRPGKVGSAGEPTPKAKPPPLTGASQPPPLPRRRDAAGPRTPSPASSPPPRRQASGGEPALAAADLTEMVGIEELRSRLVERARLLKRQNHFEALGVSHRAGLDEIQRAWSALSRELHPDRLRRVADGAVPADARALAEQINHQLTTALETLSDERRRVDYKARLEQGQRTAVAEDVNRLLRAESRSRRGDQALDAGRYDEAARHFGEAIAISPDEGEFVASLAWALYQQTPDDPVVQADAISRLQQAVDLAPRWDRGWLWLGRVLQRAGRPGEALKQFARALQCNPDNREAQAELRLGR